MSQTSAFSLFDRYCRRGDLGAGVSEHVDLGGVSLRIGGWAFVASWRLGPASMAEAAGVVVDEARARGVPVMWRLYEGDGPDGLAAVLERYGFKPASREELMVFDLAAPLPPATPDGPQTQRVTGEAGLDMYLDIVSQAFGTPVVPGAARRAALLSAQSVHTFVAGDAAGAMSAGQMDITDTAPVVLLRGGSTLPARRGQGGYTALVHDRLRLARAAGKSHAFVEALPASQPILAALGFRPVRAACSWVRDAGGEGV